MHVLVIGGTRNLGHGLVQALLARRHEVAVLNRGRTPDRLPAGVERLRADRTDAAELARAVAGRTFDAAVDTTLYRGAEVAPLVGLLGGRIGHYVFVSSGQVYLVREGLARPFREEGYDGPLLPEPPPGSDDHEEWLYGVGKRDAEDALREAWQRDGFPCTTLRLPMVHGERDHFHRLLGYVLRLDDGGPILAPASPRHALRHVDADDVVAAITAVIESGRGKGEAFNVSQDETLSLEELLRLLGEIVGVEPRVTYAPRERLAAAGLLPGCSPFSGRWMSELDNARGKRELGLAYTPLRETLARIVASYRAAPPPIPEGYRRRRDELALLAALATSM